MWEDIYRSFNLGECCRWFLQRDCAGEQDIWEQSESEGKNWREISH